MRVMVFGAMHMVGKSTKTGAAYDMARLYVASDLSDRTTEAYRRTACGFEAAEVDCDAGVVLALKGRTFPCILDLETDMRMQGGKLVPFVVAINQQQAKAA